jgi:hypothetical protein
LQLARDPEAARAKAAKAQALVQMRQQEMTKQLAREFQLA